MILCEMCGNPTEYVSVGRASRLLDRSDITIRKWIKQGKLPGTMRVAGVTGPMMYKIPVTALVPLLEIINE